MPTQRLSSIHSRDLLPPAKDAVWIGPWSPPRHWFDTFSTILTGMGFNSTPHNHCVFKATPIPDEPPIYLGCYVDDFIYYSRSDRVKEWFENPICLPNFGSDWAGCTSPRTEVVISLQVSITHGGTKLVGNQYTTRHWISGSSCEAELKSMDKGVKVLQYLRNLMMELDLIQAEHTIALLNDNVGAIDVSLPITS